MTKKVKQGGNCPNFKMNNSTQLNEFISALIVCLANQARPYQKGLTAKMIELRDMLRNLRDYMEWREEEERNKPPMYEDD